MENKNGISGKSFLDKASPERFEAVICRKGENNRFSMGGVAEKIVRNAPVSVVTVPQADEK